MQLQTHLIKIYPELSNLYAVFQTLVQLLVCIPTASNNPTKKQNVINKYSGK